LKSSQGNRSGFCLKKGLLTPPVIVLDADDVILAEIAAGLHLDQLQQDLSGVLEPVHRAHRDIDRLVLVHGLDVVIDGDSRRAAHHDPVLGAMVVLLQRQPVARLDDDAFHLMAVAIVDRLIAAPGAMHLDVLFGDLRRDGLQFRHQPFQAVGVLLRRSIARARPIEVAEEFLHA
jgi:hypothetical protein